MIARTRPLHALGLLLALGRPTGDLQAEVSCCIKLPEVHFSVNSAQPLGQQADFGCVRRWITADRMIAEMAMTLRENPTITLLITGHADEEETNVELLSNERARRVACRLVSEHGIEAGRLAVEGWGSLKPRFDHADLKRIPRSERERGKALNRRVEFLIIGFNWVPLELDPAAAVRSLSDPAPATRPSENFCDQQQETFTCGRTGSEEGAPALEDVLPASGVQEETPDTTDASQMTAPEPSLLTNPIEGDRITIIGLPGGPRGGQAEVLTLDGRSLYARSFAQVLAGERVTIDLPSLPAASAYLVRINIGARSWSLRFVKR